jgi:LmbE family N-acetylglucosaminyl deacetylase
MAEFNRSVVVVHAHPDDTEAFCGGTLKLLKDRGFRITVVTVTAGGLGGMNMSPAQTIARRKAEAKAAAKLLDAHYVCLDQHDGYAHDCDSARVACTEILRRYEAGVVITHLPTDYHADHRAACQIVEAAAMVASLDNVPCGEQPLPITPLLYHSSPLGMTDPLGTAMHPHFYVDITNVIDAKMQLLGCHESQIELMRHMHRMDDFFAEMKKGSEAYGREAGVQYAEAFWQHRGGGFQKTPLLQQVLQQELIEASSLADASSK